MTGCLNLTGKNLRDSDIKGLSRMTTVSEIILSDNQITNLSVLSELTQPEKLLKAIKKTHFSRKTDNLLK